MIFVALIVIVVLLSNIFDFMTELSKFIGQLVEFEEKV